VVGPFLDHGSDVPLHKRTLFRLSHARVCCRHVEGLKSRDDVQNGFSYDSKINVGSIFIRQFSNVLHVPQAAMKDDLRLGSFELYVHDGILADLLFPPCRAFLAYWSNFPRVSLTNSEVALVTVFSESSELRIDPFCLINTAKKLRVAYKTQAYRKNVP
jgi:hypothetical protein